MILADFMNDCHTILQDSKDSKVQEGRHYIMDIRNMSKNTILSHNIGYCPSDFKLPKEVQFYGKDMSNLREKDKGFEYFIKGRIILPIFSEFGNPIGFATRKPTSEPGNTWWNIAHPFKKGQHLFLLNKTRQNIFKNNKIYLVEGYIDGILLLQEGLNNVCAIMGTNLSHRKVGLIARYCNNVCLCLDVDKNNAGQKGQEKSIYTLSEFGFCDSISVIDHLEVGQDPDEYVVKNGISKFLNGERRLSDNEIEKICNKVRKQSKR